MEDYLVKSVAENGQFRAYAVNATALVEEAHQIHDTWSAASAALGRAMVGTLLLATSGLQGEAGMTVKIQGDGPVGFIVVDGTAQGTVKAYMQNPHGHLPLNAKGKIDLAAGTMIDNLSASGDLYIDAKNITVLRFKKSINTTEKLSTDLFCYNDNSNRC